MQVKYYFSNIICHIMLYSCMYKARHIDLQLPLLGVQLLSCDYNQLKDIRVEFKNITAAKLP